MGRKKKTREEEAAVKEEAVVKEEAAVKEEEKPISEITSITVMVNKDLFRQFRAVALFNNRSIRSLVAEFMKNYIEDYFYSYKQKVNSFVTKEEAALEHGTEEGKNGNE